MNDKWKGNWDEKKDNFYICGSDAGMDEYLTGNGFKCSRGRFRIRSDEREDGGRFCAGGGSGRAS